MTVKLKGSNIPRFILESIFVILFIIELFIRWASLKRQGSSCRIVSCSMVCNQKGSCIRPLKTRLVEYYCSGLVTQTTHTHTPFHLRTFQAINFLPGWMECLWRHCWILRPAVAQAAHLWLDKEYHMFSRFAVLSRFVASSCQLVLASGVDCFVLSLIGIGGQACFRTANGEWNLLYVYTSGCSSHVWLRNGTFLWVFIWSDTLLYSDTSVQISAFSKVLFWFCFVGFKRFPRVFAFFLCFSICSEAQSNPLCAPCLFLSSFSLGGVQPDCNQATEQPSTSFENQFQKNGKPPVR